MNSRDTTLTVQRSLRFLDRMARRVVVKRTSTVATVIGSATEILLKGAGGASATAGAVKVLNVSWPDPVLAAVVGALLGAAGAVAKILRTSCKDPATGNRKHTSKGPAQ